MNFPWEQFEREDEHAEQRAQVIGEEKWAFLKSWLDTWETKRWWKVGKGWWHGIWYDFGVAKMIRLLRRD